MLSSCCRDPDKFHLLVAVDMKGYTAVLMAAEKGHAQVRVQLHISYPISTHACMCHQQHQHVQLCSLQNVLYHVSST
jgi:hypothetical protein